MNDKTIDLDEHRGMAAQKATESRRLAKDVADDHAGRQARKEAFETVFAAMPAEDWEAMAEKIRFVLSLFAEITDPRDTKRQTLIAGVLADMDRLQAAMSKEPSLVAAPKPDGE